MREYSREILLGKEGILPLSLSAWRDTSAQPHCNAAQYLSSIGILRYQQIQPIARTMYLDTAQPATGFDSLAK